MTGLNSEDYECNPAFCHKELIIAQDAGYKRNFQLAPLGP